MVNPQLLEFVRLQLKMGASEQDIRQALASGTWTPSDIEEALATFKIPTAASAPTSASASVPTIAPVPTRVEQQAETIDQVATLTAHVVVGKPLTMTRHNRTALWVGLFLIVVVIVGGSVFFNIQKTKSVQEHARDLKRFADLQGLQVGLILYKGSYGSYPATLLAIVPQYVSHIPTDPATNGPYSYQVNGSAYKLCATMEESNPPLPTPLRSDQTFSGKEYCVASDK